MDIIDIQNLQQVPRPAQRGLHLPETPGAAADSGDLAVDPALVAQTALALADQRPSLGVPLSTPSVDQAEGRATEVVDPNVLQATATLLTPFASAPTVSTAAGVQPADLAAQHSKSQAATALYELCTNTEQDAEDSQRSVAQVLRDLRPQIRGGAARVKASLSPADQQELQALLDAIDREESRLPQASAARAKQTQAGDAKQAAALADQQKREDLLRTFINVRRGGSASPADISAAYQALSEGATSSAPAPAPASNRRSPGR